MSSFTHLHVHSYYSFLDGTMSPEELIQQARKLKFRHLALTDHNALYGAVEFYQKATAAGLHPIIGSEISLEDGSQLVLLVKNTAGYRNLCRLLSTGHLRGGHLKFQLTLNDLFRHKQGLIVLSGGQKGKLWRMAQRREIEPARQYCRQMRAVFGEDFWIELQHFEPNDFLVNLRLRDLAVQHQIGLVATNDVHLRTGADWPLRQVLHAIDANTLVDRVQTAGSRQQYLKSAREMRQLFAKFPDAVANTEVIARQCQFEFSLGKPIFPKLELPPGETSFSYLWKEAF